MNENTVPVGELNVKDELPEAKDDCPNESPIDVEDGVEPKVKPEADDVSVGELGPNKLAAAAGKKEELVPELEETEPSEKANPELVNGLVPEVAGPNKELPKPEDDGEDKEPN